MSADLKYPAFAGCQPAIQRTASPRHTPGGVAPIGNRLYRGVARRTAPLLPSAHALLQRQSSGARHSPAVTGLLRM